MDRRRRNGRLYRYRRLRPEGIAMQLRFFGPPLRECFIKLNNWI
jgi:hypothetical protein